MNLLLVIVLSILILYLSRRFSFLVGDNFNPYSIMCYIWVSFISLALIFGSSVDYYELGYSVIFLSYSFLFIIGITSWILIKFFNRGILSNTTIDFNTISAKKVSIVAIALFIFFLIGNILFWNDVNNLIGIRMIIEDAGYFKYLLLSGRIDENSIKYLGRGFNLTGAILTLAYYASGKKKKYLIMLAVFLILSFLNIRREPMILAMSSILAVVFLVNRQSSRKIVKSLSLIGILFLFIFFVTSSLLNPNSNIGVITYEYAVGSFPSLQAMIDNGYHTDNKLPLGYTLYFVYAILKYFDRNLTPPSVVLESITHKATNVYTALAYPVIDSGGDILLMITITVFYAIFIGIIYGISIILINRKVNFITISLYYIVLSLAVRSYMNPVFSHLDILFILFYGIILNSIVSIRNKKVKRIKRV